MNSSEPGAADAVAAYVRAAGDITVAPLPPHRAAAVAAAMSRLADFAADLTVFELSDDIEVAGVYTP